MKAKDLFVGYQSDEKTHFAHTETLGWWLSLSFGYVELHWSVSKFESNFVWLSEHRGEHHLRELGTESKILGAPWIADIRIPKGVVAEYALLGYNIPKELIEE